MFNSPAGGAGGLFQSPVSGFVSPAAQIGESELVIEQVSQLTSQLAQKQNIIGPGELSQDRVANLTSDLALKADATLTTAALAGKADISDLSAKVDLTAMNTALAGKAGVSDLNAKADSTATTAALAGKANVSDMNAKADLTAMNTALAGKADASDLNAKADAASTTTALAGKADAAATTAALAGKADVSDLNVKADAATTTAALAGKADATATTAALAGKADVTDLNAKADLAAMNTALATKANVSDLNAKADAATTTTALAGKADSSTLSGYATTTTVAALQSDLNNKATTTQLAALSSGLAGKEDTIQDQGLAQSKVQGLSTALAFKASTTELAIGLASKQDTIADQSLAQSKVQNLSTDLATKADTSTLSNYVTSSALGTHLSLKANATDVYTQTQVNNLVNAKQNVIQDGDLTIAKTNGLQAAIDAAASSGGGTTIDSTTHIQVASLTTASVKAPSAGSLTLTNNAGTGIVVASSGAVGILKTNPQEALDVYGNCAISGTISVDRIYANIYFAYSGGDHAFCDFAGQSRLLLGSASNTFLYGCVMPSLIVGSTNILTAITNLQNAGGTDLSNYYTKTESDTLINAKQNTLSTSTDIDINAIQAKDLQLTAAVGDASMTIQSAGEGQDCSICFSNPYNATSAPKLAAIIVEGRSNFSRSNFHICLSNYGGNNDAQPVAISDACLTITPHNKNVHIPGSLSVAGSFSNSDASIKENVRSLASTDALAMLKVVEPKVYSRTDGPLGTRVGYLAQQVLENLPPDWQNVVRSTASEAETDSEGRVVRPADPGLLQIDYSRLGSPILWECCRTMLARIEALEAASISL